MDASQLDQLIAACSSDSATEDIFAPIAALQAYGEFCNSFSHRIAHEYAVGRLSFGIADRAMNRLHTFSYVTQDRGMPDYSWEVYLAFDAGEYQHSDDLDGVSSESKCTRPAIQAIVARDLAG
jgi:hypothetical protein